jgi:cob(I)alamin adenosyltransferase
MKGLETQWSVDPNVQSAVIMADLLHLSNRWMEAELELSTNKKQRIEAIEANLKRMQEYEKKIKSLINKGGSDKGGSVAKWEVARTKSRRLEIEIMLAKEKGE